SDLVEASKFRAAAVLGDGKLAQLIAPACFRACHTSPHEESPYAAPARSVEPVSHHPARPLPGTCSPPLAPKSRMPPPTAPRTTLARRSANLAPHASSPAATPNTPQKRRHARRSPAPFVAS